MLPFAQFRPLWLALAVPFYSEGVRADDDIMHRILIEGRRGSQLGTVDSAAAGLLNNSQLAARAVFRPGELFEAIPGMVVSQPGGEGKASQYFLRGFNLDHGTDLKTTLDDMPVNQRSHAHGQGWTDLNFLIPEMVARLAYRKGPYSAQDGDFASAGSVAITYVNRLPQPLVTASLGQNGYRRAMAATPVELGAGSALLALEMLRNDGPYTHSDDYRRLNAMLRFSHGYANNGWSVTAMAYRARWNATDQIPLRVVQAGRLGPFDSLDPSAGGFAQRHSISGVWRRSGKDSASKLSAYLIANRLDLYSNFTYFLSDPLHGDQFAQPDRRVTSGMDASQTWHVHGTEASHDVTLGARLQNDNVFNGLYGTNLRRRHSTKREDHIVESSLGIFLDAKTQWNPRLRSVVGVRADRFWFKVNGDDGQRRKEVDAIVSPSANLIFSPSPQTELFLQIGNGFHSNDARGVVASRTSGLARSRGYELGFRAESMSRLQAAVSLYRLDFDSELVYLGDAGTTEAGPASRRLGLEFSSSFKLHPSVSVDLNLARARARTRRSGELGRHIPGAVEGLGELGMSWDPGGSWSGSLRLRYLGGRPLDSDGQVRSRASSLLSGRISYLHSKMYKWTLEASNLTARRGAAAAYYHASQLRSEILPRDDIHFRPIEPRTFRVTMSTTW